MALETLQGDAAKPGTPLTPPTNTGRPTLRRVNTAQSRELSAECWRAVLSQPGSWEFVGVVR